MSRDTATARRERRESQHESGPPLERLIGALGAVVVVALVAFLGYQAVAGGESGVELTAEVSRIERSGDQFVAHIRVENDGGETASGVSVAGRLSVDGTTVEQATTTISYVPPTSYRNAALVFGRDPRQGELTVRAAGYELP